MKHDWLIDGLFSNITVIFFFKELIMNINIGSTDRMLRVIAGVIIIAVGIYYQSWWGVVGLVPLLTGLFRFCPLYKMLGTNTCKL